MQPECCQILKALAAGYFVSVLGVLIIWPFHTWRKDKLDPPAVEHKRANPVITGLIEQIVFTPFVFAQPAAAGVAMAGWLSLKMAATWNKSLPTVANDPAAKLKEMLDWHSHSFLALLCGFMSMAFAGAGGALARMLTGLPVIAGWT